MKLSIIVCALICLIEAGVALAQDQVPKPSDTSKYNKIDIEAIRPRPELKDWAETQLRPAVEKMVSHYHRRSAERGIHAPTAL